MWEVMRRNLISFLTSEVLKSLTQEIVNYAYCGRVSRGSQLLTCSTELHSKSWNGGCVHCVSIVGSNILLPWERAVINDTEISVLVRMVIVNCCPLWLCSNPSFALNTGSDERSCLALKSLGSWEYKPLFSSSCNCVFPCLAWVWTRSCAGCMESGECRELVCLCWNARPGSWIQGQVSEAEKEVQSLFSCGAHPSLPSSHSSQTYLCK